MTDEDGTVWHLHVTEENIGEVLVLVVAGRISNATAGDLGRALARPDNSRLRGIIVDLSAVDYVNSAGLQQTRDCCCADAGVALRARGVRSAPGRERCIPACRFDPTSHDRIVAGSGHRAAWRSARGHPQ